MRSGSWSAEGVPWALVPSPEGGVQLRRRALAGSWSGNRSWRFLAEGGVGRRRPSRVSPGARGWRPRTLGGGSSAACASTTAEHWRGTPSYSLCGARWLAGPVPRTSFGGPRSPRSPADVRLFAVPPGEPPASLPRARSASGLDFRGLVLRSCRRSTGSALQGPAPVWLGPVERPERIGPRGCSGQCVWNRPCGPPPAFPRPSPT
jgi:hypothetical protein